MKLLVSAIAPSIRPLLTKMQGGLVRPNLPHSGLGPDKQWGRSGQAVG